MLSMNKNIKIMNNKKWNVVALVGSIDKRWYKIHLDFAAVKDFDVFISIKAGSNDLDRTSKATDQYVSKP